MNPQLMPQQPFPVPPSQSGPPPRRMSPGVQNPQGYAKPPHPPSRYGADNSQSQTGGPPGGPYGPPHPNFPPQSNFPPTQGPSLGQHQFNASQPNAGPPGPPYSSAGPPQPNLGPLGPSHPSAGPPRPNVGPVEPSHPNAGPPQPHLNFNGLQGQQQQPHMPLHPPQQNGATFAAPPALSPIVKEVQGPPLSEPPNLKSNQFGANQFHRAPALGHSHRQPPMINQQPPSQFNQQSLSRPALPGQVSAANSFDHTYGQPHMGQPPLPGQSSIPDHLMSGPPHHPPMPGPGQPPLPGRPQGKPPLPGQFPMQGQPNQLDQQMQDLNLGGQKQYFNRPPMNGEGGPHMPPPLGHGSYVNGQQQAAPGFPPMPGQGPMMSPTGYPQSYQQQQQQQRRLDPDQMPSPIQVMQDDQHTRSGVFCTNQKGLVPPLVTTNFVVQDQGNASPRFMRSTMYNIPVAQDLMKQTSVPFGLVISPMARVLDQEYPPPIVNFGELGPVRCIRCKAYMCPFMQFVDGGRRFQCLFCKAATDVPTEYFQHLDHTGQRMDRYERPELVLGAYEFVATKDYCRNNTFPKPPAVVFIIDVSYNNVKSGLVNLLCSEMKRIIKNLPVDQGMDKSNMRVGFVTYNSSVHFYNINGALAAPQMMVVGDVQDMFMPLLDGFLCTPEESESVIEVLMEQIPLMFADTRETETVLLPAVLAGVEALKASDCSGKLMVFHSSLPIAEAPGKLKNRDDRKVLGTDKERTVLTPQNQAYGQLGQDCVGAGCSVDLFLFNNAYIDVATIGQVARLSGGEVYKYTYFQADLDGERFVTDVVANIKRPIAFDAIMRVRTSTGIRPTDFYGHFFMSNTTDMELASIDCDKAVAVEIKHDDKLTEEEGVYVQVALLYTSCSGQRRLRVLNLSLKTCSQMADLYRSCDLDTLVNFFAKQGVYRLLESSPKAVKDNIVARAAQILANYRKNCASPSSPGQLILPECMKLMPLYVNCLLKSDALSGGSDMTVDDRSFIMQALMIMDVPSSVSFFYPHLIPLHDIQPGEEPIEVPPFVRCSAEKMVDQGVYLLENGIHMLLWIGLNVDPDFCQHVFGVPSSLQIDVEKAALPRLENPLSKAVHSVVDQVRARRHRCMRMTLVRQREKLEPIFKHFLVEDRGVDGSPSYVDFLCHMHKEIRTVLS